MTNSKYEIRACGWTELYVVVNTETGLETTRAYPLRVALKILKGCNK